MQKSKTSGIPTDTNSLIVGSRQILIPQEENDDESDDSDVQSSTSTVEITSSSSEDEGDGPDTERLKDSLRRQQIEVESSLKSLLTEIRHAILEGGSELALAVDGALSAERLAFHRSSERAILALKLKDNDIRSVLKKLSKSRESLKQSRDKAATFQNKCSALELRWRQSLAEIQNLRTELAATRSSKEVGDTRLASEVSRLRAKLFEQSESAKATELSLRTELQNLHRERASIETQKTRLNTENSTLQKKLKTFQQALTNKTEKQEENWEDRLEKAKKEFEEELKRTYEGKIAILELEKSALRKKLDERENEVEQKKTEELIVIKKEKEIIELEKKNLESEKNRLHVDMVVLQTKVEELENKIRKGLIMRQVASTQTENYSLLASNLHLSESDSSNIISPQTNSSHLPSNKKTDDKAPRNVLVIPSPMDSLGEAVTPRVEVSEALLNILKKNVSDLSQWKQTHQVLLDGKDSEINLLNGQLSHVRTLLANLQGISFTAAKVNSECQTDSHEALVAKAPSLFAEMVLCKDQVDSYSQTDACSMKLLSIALNTEEPITNDIFVQTDLVSHVHAGTVTSHPDVFVSTQTEVRETEGLERDASTSPIHSSREPRAWGKKKHNRSTSVSSSSSSCSSHQTVRSGGKEKFADQLEARESAISPPQVNKSVGTRDACTSHHAVLAQNSFFSLRERKEDEQNSDSIQLNIRHRHFIDKIPDHNQQQQQEETKLDNRNVKFDTDPTSKHILQHTPLKGMLQERLAPVDMSPSFFPKSDRSLGNPLFSPTLHDHAHAGNNIWEVSKKEREPDIVIHLARCTQTSPPPLETRGTLAMSPSSNFSGFPSKSFFSPRSQPPQINETLLNDSLAPLQEDYLPSHPLSSGLLPQSGDVEEALLHFDSSHQLHKRIHGREQNMSHQQHMMNTLRNPPKQDMNFLSSANHNRFPRSPFVETSVSTCTPHHMSAPPSSFQSPSLYRGGAPVLSGVSPAASHAVPSGLAPMSRLHREIASIHHEVTAMSPHCPHRAARFTPKPSPSNRPRRFVSPTGTRFPRQGVRSGGPLSYCVHSSPHAAVIHIPPADSEKANRAAGKIVHAPQLVDVATSPTIRPHVRRDMAMQHAAHRGSSSSSSSNEMLDDDDERDILLMQLGRAELERDEMNELASRLQSELDRERETRQEESNLLHQQLESEQLRIAELSQEVSILAQRCKSDIRPAFRHLSTQTEDEVRGGVSSLKTGMQRLVREKQNLHTELIDTQKQLSSVISAKETAEEKAKSLSMKMKALRAELGHRDNLLTDLKRRLAENNDQISSLQQTIQNQQQQLYKIQIRNNQKFKNNQKQQEIQELTSVNQYTQLPNEILSSNFKDSTNIQNHTDITDSPSFSHQNLSASSLSPASPSRQVNQLASSGEPMSPTSPSIIDNNEEASLNGFHLSTDIEETRTVMHDNPSEEPLILKKSKSPLLVPPRRQRTPLLCTSIQSSPSSPEPPQLLHSVPKQQSKFKMAKLNARDLRTVVEVDLSPSSSSENENLILPSSSSSRPLQTSNINTIDKMSNQPLKTIDVDNSFTRTHPKPKSAKSKKIQNQRDESEDDQQLPVIQKISSTTPKRKSNQADADDAILESIKLLGMTPREAENVLGISSKRIVKSSTASFDRYDEMDNSGGFLRDSTIFNPSRQSIFRKSIDESSLSIDLYNHSKGSTSSLFDERKNKGGLNKTSTSIATSSLSSLTPATVGIGLMRGTFSLSIDGLSTITVVGESNSYEKGKTIQR